MKGNYDLFIVEFVIVEDMLSWKALMRPLFGQRLPTYCKINL